MGMEWRVGGGDQGPSIIFQDVSGVSGGMLTFFSQELEAGRSGWGSTLFDGLVPLRTINSF